MKKVFEIEVKWKAFFIILKGFLVTKNCLRHETASLFIVAEMQNILIKSDFT